MRPLYEFVLERLGVGRGASLLDAGCGSGLCLALASERGAEVRGLDAAPGLVEYAARAVPDASVVVGDLEELPFETDSFDFVTAFNSVLYAADPRRAIAELGRVVRPGGQVALSVGTGSDSATCAAMIHPLLPEGFVASTRTALDLTDEKAARQALQVAGLARAERSELTFTLEFPDIEAAIEAQTAAGTVAAAIQESSVEAVDGALRGFFAPRTRADGSVAMEASFICVFAKSPGPGVDGGA